METYKNIIIGFGKGGKTLAKLMASKGESVAIVEQSNVMYGGTCINVGCIPTKDLIVSAEKKMSYKDAFAHKEKLTTALRGKNYHNVADEPSATVIDGKAKFLSDTQIQITTKGQEPYTITGERIFINTGATPVLLPIKGMDTSVHCLVSQELLSLDTLPKELVIIGTGPIGLEFAALYAGYGIKVTMLDAAPDVLTRYDSDIAQQVKSDLQALGIVFCMGVSIKEVADVGDKVSIKFDDANGQHTVTADKILQAVGRKPNTEELGLQNTSVQLTERGAIKVDKHLKTTAPNIWAMGDVRGGLQFTYISLDDYRIVQNSLYGDGTRSLDNQEIVPNSIFVVPALSSVGLTEREAQQNKTNYKVFKLSSAAIPKAHILRETKGISKAIVDLDTNLILGAAIYAENSYETINLIALAIKAKIPYTVLRDQIYTHPTMSEALNDLFK